MASEPPYGAAVALSPRVRRVLAHNPGPMTETGTGTFLVGHGADLAVIDPGPALDAHLEAILAAIGSARVTAILVTHNHIDHSPLAPALKAATVAPVLGAAPIASAPSRITGGEGFDSAYAPDSVLADGESVSGDGWTLTAIHTPGHTSNHLCFALPEEDRLFSGDHVMGWSTTVIVPPDGSMGDYFASLAKLQTRTETTYHPTHGPAIDKPQAHLRGLILHRRQREAQLLELLREGPKTVSQLVATAYALVNRQLWPAAEKSVEAHLIHLAERGLAAADGALWSLV